MSYTGAWGNTTAATYDRAGPPTRTNGPGGDLRSDYDPAAARLSAQKLGTLILAVGRDALGRTGLPHRHPGGHYGDRRGGAQPLRAQQSHSFGADVKGNLLMRAKGLIGAAAKALAVVGLLATYADGLCALDSYARQRRPYASTK